VLRFDSFVNQYPSIRNVHFSKNGMVATSQTLASAAGLDILKKGGNAVDAAIATAACLTVVETTSNGIGSDAFAIIWFNGRIHGLNSSGAAPKRISIDAVKCMGHKTMPKTGFLPVTVPGAPGAWAALSKRFGKLKLIECLEPAINYAKDGYPVSPMLAMAWQNVFENFYTNLKNDEFAPWFSTFAPDGYPPQIGDIVTLPDHARTLQEVGETNSASFYSGRLANEIEAYSIKFGGYLAKDDLQAFKPEWVQPISVNYRGYDVWEMPPNGQGIVTLIALNILKSYRFNYRDDVETCHKQFEAMKLAFSAGRKHVTDPRFMQISSQEMLSEDFTDKMRGKMSDYAAKPEIASPSPGGTVYLATADGDGNMVSFIQSNYMGFGSGIVIPKTGIALQNRGADFSLDSNSINHLAGGKKTYHTIMPGFLTKNSRAVGPFGVMGGYMQPQGQLQVIMNSIDFNLNPQAALDAPRWQWIGGKTFEVESGFPGHLTKALEGKGHKINIQPDQTRFGRGQIIWRNSENGILIGGCEPRTDSAIASF
jgi:gamma-glutamyltranspeptidase/glutathione hydrolase